MEKDLLLVIDMQNVYAQGGEWCCPGTEAAAKRIKELIDLQPEGLDIVFTKFIASEHPLGTWKQYNEKYADINEDAYANELLDVFQEDAKKYPLYTKSTYSSLTVPEILAAARKAKRVLVSGVVAECCVLWTVTALIDEGVKVIYLTDGVAGLDEPKERATELMLEGLSPLHVELMTVSDYVRSLKEC